MAIPKQDTKRFFPGLGDQHEITLANVGLSVVDCTIAGDNATARTDAQLIGSTPNTGAAGMAAACGPIVHSLGTPPAAAWLMGRGPANASDFPTTVAFVTADNSAVYFRAKSWTGALLGYSVRMIAVR
jgi:hypothetical protein